MWRELFLNAKPHLAELICKQLPEEFKYFEPLWAALNSHLASEKELATDNLHKRTLTTLLFAEGFIHPAHRSLEVIGAIAECTRIFIGGNYPSDDAIRECVLQHAKRLHSDGKLLEATVQVVSEILTADSKPLPAARIDFLPNKVQLLGILLSDKQRLQLRGPRQLLEYLLWHPQEDIHWISGFLLFRGWRRGKTSDFKKSFGEQWSRLRGASKSIDGTPILVLDHTGDSYTLVRWLFESNVLEAKKIYQEVVNFFNSKNYESAAQKATEALKIYPSCQEARTKLAACYIAKDCKNVTTPDAEGIMKHLRHQHKLFLDAIQWANKLPEEVFIESEATLNQWRVQVAQIAVLCDGLGRWLEKRGITFEDQLDCYRFMDKIGQLLQSKDENSQRSLWQEITKNPIFVKAKLTFVQMLKSYLKREISTNEKDEFNSFVVLIKSNIVTAEISTPAELASYIANMAYHSWLDEKQTATGLSLTQQKLVRTLQRQRKLLTQELQRAPTLAELSKAMKRDESKLQEILKWERLTRASSYDESGPSDDEER